MGAKSFFTILFFIAVLLILVAPFIKCNSDSKKSYHNFIDSAEFKSLSREMQIQKCGSCHKEIYENEILGPHYNSYKKLLEHRAFVNSDKYDSCFYTHRVNSVFEDCAGCHAPKNLYETILKEYNSNQDKFISEMVNKPLPENRKGERSRITGVDCFSCHFNGNDFISLKQSKISEDAKKAEQSIHMIAKNNLNCYPCHFDVLDDRNPAVAIKQTGSFVCNNCHIEQKSNAVKSHYYFWNSDPGHKTNPLTENILNDFTFIDSAEKNLITIKWKNKSMPHTLPIATELLFKISLISRKGKVLNEKTIRINRKRDYDKNMFNELGGRYLDGTLGDLFPVKGEINYTVDYKKGDVPDSVKISLIRKPQFWIQDSLGKEIKAKVIAL